MRFRAKNPINPLPDDLKELVSKEAAKESTTILKGVLGNAPFLQSHGNLEIYFSNSLSDFYKENKAIRGLEVSRHFYEPDSRKHFYSVVEDDHKLYGFSVDYQGFTIFTEVVKEKPILDLECEEDTYPPRTLGDVFDD